MFARRVIIKLKPGSAAEFGRIAESEIGPLLCAQRGLRHTETFVTPEILEAVVNSYWDTEEYAEAHHRATHPRALEALAGVIDGLPRVETFGISSSTFHTITAHRREAYRLSRLGRG